MACARLGVGKCKLDGRWAMRQTGREKECSWLEACRKHLVSRLLHSSVLPEFNSGVCVSAVDGWFGDFQLLLHGLLAAFDRYSVVM